MFSQLHTPTQWTVSLSARTKSNFQIVFFFPPCIKAIQIKFVYKMEVARNS